VFPRKSALRRRKLVEKDRNCCEATEGIKENFGVEKALRYLIGEKFYTFLKLLRDTMSGIDKLEDSEGKPDSKKLAELKKDLAVFMKAKEDFISKAAFSRNQKGSFLA